MEETWILKVGLIPFGQGTEELEKGTKWLYVGENVPNELTGLLLEVLYRLPK
jgi:hypothetical protein